MKDGHRRRWFAGSKAANLKRRLRRNVASFWEDSAFGLARLTGAPKPAYQRVADQPLRIENLERRELLAADLMINEFLARNDGGLRDGNGRTSDWVELFNTSSQAMNLEGYRLTDDAQTLNKWVFPHVEIAPGEYLVVFASGAEADNSVDPDGNLHTNFSLSRGGEYLALVSPDNSVISEYGPQGTQFPEQVTNVSFGMAQSLSLIAPDTESYYWVPTDQKFDATWTSVDFDAAGNGFEKGTASFGIETRTNDRTNFAGVFQTELPQGSQGVYSRMEFEIGDPTAISNLALTLQYDNGFVAYLNGTQVVADRAPENAGWFSTATDSSRRDSVALNPETFDLSSHVGALRAGKNVLAIHGLNHFSDDSDFLLVAELTAGASDLEAATGTPAKVGYITTPTPGAPNGSNSEVYTGFVEDTSFSVDRGFYDEPFQVEITTATEGADIYYTTDGTIPEPENGTKYTGPVTINGTTNLRARAFKEDHLPTNTDTQTYLFPDQIFTQTGDGIESVRWGHAGPDWEMDPDVLNHPDPISRPQVDDLLSIPTLSLTVNWDEFFGTPQGIYINGESVEIGTSVELIQPDGSDGFQHDGSVQVVGGSSTGRWKSDKLSMRLKFNREFGAGDLEFPVFGDDAAQSFDTLVVDAHLNNVWHYGGGCCEQNLRAQYLRDQYTTELQRELGGTATHDYHVFVYLNGVFWGMHRLHERPDDNFAAAYLGGDNDDYEVIKHRQNTVVHGTGEHYRELHRLAAEDLSVQENYDAVAEKLDIDDFMAYMLTNFYVGNTDWAHQNWYASFNKVDPNGKWRFHSWDAEHVLKSLTDNATTKNDAGGPTRIHQQLAKNSEYRLRFADLVHRQLFNDGVLTPDRAPEIYLSLQEPIDRALRIESARWGDNRRTQPFTYGTEYLTELTYRLNEYFPQRTDVLLNQLRSSRVGLYPDLDAAEFNQHGGVISSDLDLTLSAPEGTVYYTTDGNDPRVFGGELSPTAVEYAGALKVTENVTIKARVLKDGEWSALTEASFLVASDQTLRITELNYNPHQANQVPGATEADADKDDFEFIELMNTGSSPIDLNGIQLAESGGEGIRFIFGAQQLAAGERIVVAGNKETFQTRYGTNVRIATGTTGEDGAKDGEYGGGLSSRGEQLTLIDADGRAIQQFTYKTNAHWPQRANGGGSSLEVIDPLASYTDPSNWRSSAEFGGSPGTAGVAGAPRVSVSEILANTAAPDVDLVELHNTGSEDVAVTNWYISDTSEDYFKAKISTETTVSARGYAVIKPQDFGLDLDGINGGELLLLAADASGKPTYFAGQIEFGTAARGVSLGPWPTNSDPFIPLNTTTFGGANSGPRIGEVVISEIYYAPTDPDGPGSLRERDFEFLEITNTTDADIDLTGWRVDGDVGFEIPEGTVLAANGSAVIGTLRPQQDANKLAVFRFTAGLSDDTIYMGRIVNPDTGRRTDMDDEQGVILLSRPGLASPEAPEVVPTIVVDQIRYQSTAPWPADTMETGKSLHRTSLDSYGLASTSWVSGDISPGVFEATAVPLAGDANGDGQFNQLDIVAVLQSAKYKTGQPATFAEGDWTGDGVFDELDIVAALQTGAYNAGLAATGSLVGGDLERDTETATDVAITDWELIRI